MTQPLSFPLRIPFADHLGLELWRFEDGEAELRLAVGDVHRECGVRQRSGAAVAPVAKAGQVVCDEDAARVGLHDDIALRLADGRDAHDQPVADAATACGVDQFEPERRDTRDLFDNSAAHESTPLTISKVRCRTRSASGIGLPESICTMRTM